MIDMKIKLSSIWRVAFALILVLGMSLVMATPVGAIPNPVTNVDTAETFANIQDAIDDADTLAGHTLTVAAGAYTEDLAINKGVAIQGAGAATTTIIGAHTITADGVSLDGFTLICGGTTGVTIDSSASVVDGTTITNCAFDMTGGDSVGVYVGGGTPTNAVNNTTMSHNVFDGPDNKVANPWKIGGWFGTPIGCEVTGLYFTHNVVNKCSTPINLHDKNITSVLIDSNVYQNTDGCVYIWDDAGTTPTGVLSGFMFSNNYLNNGNSYGVAVIDATAADAPYTDANFGTGNMIFNNDFSSIVGNYGLDALYVYGTYTTYVLDAQNNWWGSASGPTHAGNTFNVTLQGETVSDNVDYVPWLTGPPGMGTSFAPVDIDGDANYASIQAAIAAATTTVITCAPGTYTEATYPLTINEAGLTLQSSGGADVTTITSAGYTYGGVPAIIDVYAANVTISGFKLIGNSTSGQRGIYLRNTGFTVTNNKIQNVGNDSIFAESSQNVITSGTISGNTITGLGYDEQGETCNPYRAGILLETYNGNTISNVMVTGNTVSNYGTPTQGEENAAIRLANVGGGNIIDVEVSGNTISNCLRGVDLRGVLLSAASPLPVSGNNISSCDTGIIIDAAPGTELMIGPDNYLYSNNTAVELNTGVYGPLLDTSGIVIDGNTICSNEFGIYFAGGMGGTISDNLICRNNDGIVLNEPVTWVEIYTNCIISNDIGVHIAGCHNIVGAAELGNLIADNHGGPDSGVHLTDTAMYNLINYNDIVHNSSAGYGVYNGNTVVVDATNNWWGSVNGPGEDGANDVSPYVQYDPWATGPVADTTVPVITGAGAASSKISLWDDGMLCDLWDGYNPHTVGPSRLELWATVTGNCEDCTCCSDIYSVTYDINDLLHGLIPTNIWEKFGFSELSPGYMSNCECGNCYQANPHDFGLTSLFNQDGVNLTNADIAEILGQELVLGGTYPITITVTDYSGNTATATVNVTIYDYQIPLNEGWNLRSAWLSLENNSWSDIVATQHTAGNITSILRWNAAYQRWENYSETYGVGWYYNGELVYAGATMEPLEGYWIFSQHNDQIGLITDRDVTAPASRQMYTGWQLIGPSIPWNYSYMLAGNALKSIEEATGGGAIGYTQVLSFGQSSDWDEYLDGCGMQEHVYHKMFRQEVWTFVADGYTFCSSWMTRSGGYWVFMANPAVLAGFNSTPLPYEFWTYWFEYY